MDHGSIIIDAHLAPVPHHERGEGHGQLLGHYVHRVPVNGPVHDYVAAVEIGWHGDFVVGARVVQGARERRELGFKLLALLLLLLLQPLCDRHLVAGNFGQGRLGLKGLERRWGLERGRRLGGVRLTTRRLGRLLVETLEEDTEDNMRGCACYCQANPSF